MDFKKCTNIYIYFGKKSINIFYKSIYFIIILNYINDNLLASLYINIL